MAALIIDEENNEEQTIDSIRVFDSEERGYFSSEELKTALKRMPGGSQIRDSEMKDILRKADPDEDGKINTQGTGDLLVLVDFICASKNTRTSAPSGRIIRNI